MSTMLANSNITNVTKPSSSCPGTSSLTAEKVGKTFAYCLIFVVSLLGNVFIGIIVFKTKTMRKPINLLIVNMAMSDLLFPVFALPWILTQLYLDSWLISGSIGLVLCKLLPFLQDASSTVSVQSLVLIAVDRFGAVVLPLRSPVISSKMCPFYILTTWIVSIAMQTPVIIAYKLVEYPGGQVCIPQWTETFAEFFIAKYALACFVLFLCTPLLLVAILYIIIIVKLKSQNFPGEQSISSNQQRLKREQNVLKMSVAIVLGFTLCWVPFSIIVLLYYFAWSHSNAVECGVTRHIWFAAQFMARANCALNPCICFIFSGNYRQGLKNLLNCF